MAFGPVTCVLASLLFLASRSQVSVDAFLSTNESPRHPMNVNAREYVVIGGNLPGLNPEDAGTQNLSKKERRQREREKGDADFKSGKYKKKKKFTINYDALEEKVTRERALLPREQREVNNKMGVKSNLGVPTKPVKTKTSNKKLSEKAARLQRQRTAGGTVNSMGETRLPQSPDKQSILIRVAKRGNKVVTMIQGLTLPMSDRKVLLKEMKAKLGGGGTLVDGVLELQGSHADKVLDMMKIKGYSMARVVK